MIAVMSIVYVIHPGFHQEAILRVHTLGLLHDPSSRKHHRYHHHGIQEDRIDSRDTTVRMGRLMSPNSASITNMT